ncbi:MAG: AAA family ATPase [Anaerolineales bacterium]|nr:AAA family ATPase [Anaerolineales bacterium]
MQEKIPVGIAGPDLNLISREYTNLVANDGRFVLSLLSNTWRALLDSLQENEPSLLLIYADLAPSPDALVSILAGLKRAIAIVLLPAAWVQVQGSFERIQSVRKVYVLPAAPAEVLNYGYSLVQTEMARTRTVAPLQNIGSANSGMAAVGTRVIAFVSAQGGVGRSTLAEAMAFELAARRSIRSLLYSFDLATPAPLRLGARYAPTAAEFLQRTEGGFRDCIQTTSDGLDVIIAPPESTAHAAATKDGEQAKIHGLVTEAYKNNYAAILLDLPCGESAWMLQPLRAASTLLLISRPTTEGVRAVGHLLKLLTEVVGSQHRFGRDAFFLVLNQRTSKSIYTATAFAGEVAKYAGWSPPVLTSVDYDPAIARAQDDGRPAVIASETLGRAAATLVETFYGTARGSEPLRKGFKIGGLKIRTSG